MTHNVNKNIDKLQQISANNRDVQRFAAPESHEENYFGQLANQHKQAKELALNFYFETLSDIEKLSSQQQFANLASQSSNTNNTQEKVDTLRQKANYFKAQADRESALFEMNQRLASTSGKETDAELKTGEKQHKQQKGHKPQHQGMDPVSRAAIDEFSSLVGNKKMTADEMSEHYLRYSRMISINSPQAWAELDAQYSNALGKAYTPDNTMDAQSKNAITNFKSTINSSMTRDEMMETFIRFSREVSVKFPQAWQELQSILSNSLPNAYSPDTSMDDQSRNAIANFRTAINNGMTADQMNETFIRFSREVSTKFPDAWKELESILNNYITNAHTPDTSMDDQSRNAVANFKTALNTNMTKDEMVEMFVRFSREVSVKFPDAWKELESTLNQSVPNAFKPNMTSDPESEQAVSDFKTSISQNHTQDDLIEMFLRFSRNISLKYPEKKNELVATLNQSLPNAFKPDTTIDADSKQLVKQFETIIQTQEMDKDDFKNIFSDYFKQIGLNLSKARKMMNDMKTSKFRESEKKTENAKTENKDAHKLQLSFNSLVENVNTINYKVQVADGELSGVYNKDDQINKIAEIDKLLNVKHEQDNQYAGLMSQISGNELANNNIKDDYLFSMSADKTAPDKKERVERDTATKTEWDMLRTMRREDLKDMVNDIPKEALTDILYSVPKYHLINGLTLLPHEQQINALTTNRFEDGLLREMPKKQLIEQLPDAYEMLPILMMIGKTENGFKNGAELIQDTLINGSKKVEEKPNDTRLQEELMPFMMEQLLNKSPRMADAKNPALGNISPVNAQINNMKEPGQVQMGQNPQVQISKIENLQPEQLRELAQEAMSKFDANDNTRAAASKRGTSENLMNFMEDLQKVDSVDAGKMAMSNLYNNQAQSLKDEVLTALSDKEILKINKFYGRDPKEMVKQMPTHVVHKQLHDLSKQQVIESYKNIDKDMIMNRIQTLPSQVLASAASDVLNRDVIQNQFFKNQNLAA